ncbi:ABC transporter substrate-binding protein [Bacillus massiliigorillae]|uniref:ABC transporter substrate-binding protein n=1 Tax=Bacillus massiliigorillae TaxID=1243664 RepID=UPI00039E0853|nr:ABC transporter substrate-binding protein [Bacillus massiliigorillae]
MKKLVSILMVLFVLVLTACGGGESVGDSDKKKTTNSDGTEIVKFWYYFSGKQEDLFKDLVKEYNKSQDKVKVEAEYVPFPDTKKQLSVGIAGGTLPDAILLDNVDNASFAAMGVLEDLTTKLEKWEATETFIEGPLNSAKYEDKYYGLPYASNCLGLFYNEELFAQAGITEPPTTWAEFREAAKKLTKGDVKGLGIAANKSEEGTFQFYPYLKSSGGDYTDLAAEGPINALSLLKDIYDDGSMNKDILNNTQDDLARQFAQGKIAMMVNGPWNISRIEKENPNLKFAITQIPKDKEFASVLGGENIALIKGGNVDPAWDFVKWLFEPERYEEFTADTGVFPARKDVLEGSDFWKNDKYLKGFVPIMDVADPRGPSPDWPKVSEAIQIAIQEALTETKSPEEAMKGAAKKVESLMNK